MSWVRAAMEKRQQEEGDRDVFDEDGDEMGIMQREWRSSMEKRLKEGYRDGIDAGKENTLQRGFGLGYKQGVNMLMPFGEVRGTLSALLTWCHLHKPESSVTTQLKELLSAVCRCEERLMKCLSSISEEPHPSELSTSVEDMGLGSHEHGGECKEAGLCASDSNCCTSQNSSPSSILSCKTTQQLGELVKHELKRFLGETFSVAEQLGLSADILCHLQKLKN
ncbi:hypothetical protein FKM82_006662 [Ascaphus truei]|uniref:protein YAE1 homolog n=1 Tax=Ascaphus truei TaxID=8439 RepID=UPI003F5972E4